MFGLTGEVLLAALASRWPRVVSSARSSAATSRSAAAARFVRAAFIVVVAALIAKTAYDALRRADLREFVRRRPDPAASSTVATGVAMDLGFGALLSIALGVGLAAATGFRVFLPLLDRSDRGRVPACCRSTTALPGSRAHRRWSRSQRRRARDTGLLHPRRRPRARRAREPGDARRRRRRERVGHVRRSAGGDVASRDHRGRRHRGPDQGQRRGRAREDGSRNRGARKSGGEHRRRRSARPDCRYSRSRCRSCAWSRSSRCSYGRRAKPAG